MLNTIRSAEMNHPLEVVAVDPIERERHQRLTDGAGLRQKQSSDSRPERSGFQPYRRTDVENWRRGYEAALAAKPS